MVVVLSGLVLLSSGCATDAKPEDSVAVTQQTVDEATRLAREAKQAADEARNIAEEAKSMAAQAQATADAANEKAERMFKKSMSK